MKFQQWSTLPTFLLIPFLVSPLCTAYFWKIHPQLISKFTLKVFDNSAEKYYSSLKLRNDPPDLASRPDRRGGGSENGIRVISKLECESTVQAWLGGLGFATSSGQMDLLSMYLALDQFSHAIPGRKPLRNELVAFGLFEDGKIQCIAAIYWKKNVFPTEMELQVLTTSPGNDGTIQTDSSMREKGLIQQMLDFICEMCLDNAIVPIFSPLTQQFLHFRSPYYDKYFATHGEALVTGIDDQETRFMKSSASQHFDEIVRRFIDKNRAPIVCLDTIPSSWDLGLYWYRTFIPVRSQSKSFHEDSSSAASLLIPLFFRGKRGRDSEFEILFQWPSQGTTTGSGTAAGRFIIPVGDEELEEHADTEETNMKSTKRLERLLEAVHQHSGIQQINETGTDNATVQGNLNTTVKIVTAEMVITVAREIKKKIFYPIL